MSDNRDPRRKGNRRRRTGPPRVDLFADTSEAGQPEEAGTSRAHHVADRLGRSSLPTPEPTRPGFTPDIQRPKDLNPGPEYPSFMSMTFGDLPFPPAVKSDVDALIVYNHPFGAPSGRKPASWPKPDVQVPGEFGTRFDPSKPWAHAHMVGFSPEVLEMLGMTVDGDHSMPKDPS